MKSLWRIVHTAGGYELHRGNSTAPYTTWQWDQKAIAEAVVLVLNIVQYES